MSVGQSIIGAIVALVVTFGAAAVGAGFPVDGWYEGLIKPAWNPPNWLFGPVWGVLYLLMAVAAWLVWRKSGLSGAAVPLGLFGLQLVLNAAWSWLFFGLHRPGVALVEIVLLWAAILATMISFWRVQPPAGWLLLPYQLWVTFATALNFALWRLNG